MLMGEHVRPYRRIPRANSKKDDIAMRERIRLFCRRVSRCKEGPPLMCDRIRVIRRLR